MTESNDEAGAPPAGTGRPDGARTASDTRTPDNMGPGNDAGTHSDVRNPADAELADAMGSIEAIGEDWRSRERGTEGANDDEERDHG